MLIMTLIIFFMKKFLRVIRNHNQCLEWVSMLIFSLKIASLVKYVSPERSQGVKKV